jgi:uncharacterized protein involved in outer membrane biogenesis
MNDNPTPSPVPVKRRRWLRWLAILAGGLALLLVVAWFVVTSAGFFKGVILPRVGAAAHATITVEDAAISPFSSVVLKNLKVQTTGSEPLVTATEVRVRFHLMDILGGNLNVEEIALVSPVVNLIENADGTSNLDPLTKSTGAKETKPAPSAQSAKPVRINLKKLALTDATIHKIKNYPGGTRDVTELANINVTLTDLQNGQSGKLTLGADAKIDNHPPAPAASGSLQAKIAGEYTFTLAADLKPVSIEGSTHLTVSQAAGTLSELAALGADLDCAVTPTEIKQVALRLQKSGAALGGLRVSGPFDMEKTEGHLMVELLALDRQVLNLAGAASGLDFGGTTISATNEIELTKSGAVIAAHGSLTAARLQITRAAQSTPVLDVRADYNVTVDRTAQSARLQTFTINATQNQTPLVHAELSSPMNLSWGNAADTAGDSALAVSITGLNLADWRAFAADLAPEGVVNAKLKLASQQAGKQLAFDLDSSISGLSARFGSNAINHADVRLQAQGRGVDFKQFDLTSYRLDLAQRGESALTVSGTGTFDRTTSDADLQVTVQSALAKLLAIFPQPGAKLGGGTLDFKGRVSSKAKTQSVTGELALADLVMSNVPGTPLAAKLQLDASVSQQVADLRQCQLTLTPTARAKNELKLTGKVDFSKPTAITGNLKLLADALDVTGYYDLLGGKTATAPVAPAPAAPSEVEPAAVSLPFHDFVVEASIGRLFLHDVDVANFQTTLKLDGGRVLLQPFTLTLNGAPVTASADLNLGVPGYQYDVSFTAKGVPIAPLADSFSSAYRGKATGDFSANAKIKGAGITGVSLQKNLAGDVSLVLTNADIQLAGPKAKTLIAPIAFALGLEELQRSPVSGLNAQLKMGGGKIAVTQCDVQSDAFRTDTTGEIPIAPVLNDSPFNNWPLNFALSRNLAAKSRLMPANTPTNAAYVKLPTFTKLTGTIGKPEAKTDKLVITGLLARSIGGVPGLVGGDAGKILQGIGGLLGGQAAQPATEPSTNAPAAPPANQSQPINLFDLFKKK